MDVVSSVERHVVILREVLYCTFPDGPEDITVRNNSDSESLDSRSGLEGSVEHKCKTEGTRELDGEYCEVLDRHSDFVKD